MPNINSTEDFLRALSENREWREAVRDQILDEQQRRLPAAFEAFVDRVDRSIENQERILAELQASNAELRESNTDLKETNARLAETVERLEAGQERLTKAVEQLEQGQERLTSAVEELEQGQERLTSAVEELQRFVADQREFNARQREFNESFLRRLDQLATDVGHAKGGYALFSAARQAPGLAFDMGYQFVKQLDMADILALIPRSARDRKPANELRSFRQADIIVEASADNGETVYIAAEVSFTAHRRDTRRVRRNAHYLTEFTGRPAHPAIASIRNDYEIVEEIESGDIFWYQLVEEEMLRH